MSKRSTASRMGVGLALCAGFLLLPSPDPAVAQESQSPSQAAAPTPTPRPRTLGDLARTLKLRPPLKNAGAKSGVIVITDSNLQEYAAKGGLTTATGQPQQGRGQAALANAQQARASAEQEAKRKSWRSTYQRQAQLVSSIKTRIKKLDEEIPGLWRQFYAWDDPAYRDGVIKPKLDKALNERNTLAKRLPTEEAKLPEILEQARRDGAEPGWFRDLKGP